ncbi:Polyol transporter like [Quillaja saponaria]|uniref:Polyol transporter like n=1 Tax=Quillaja saponaria TaxID=32244 RepID=A0AAD7QBD5_QUISA|nr:Polyol transporter like [Quillaja saponaria]
MAAGKAETTTVYGKSEKIIEDFDPLKKAKRNKFAFACAILASMTSILLGYDIGVMSGASIYIKKNLKISDIQLEVLIGIINLHSLIGSFLAGRTSDWIGRRCTIVLAGAIFFVGALLMGFAPNYAFLMFGRFVTGVGVGYAAVIAPVYTAEVSPASSRGFLTSFPEVFINLGILFGFVSNFAFSKLPINLGWRLMLGIGAIPSVFLAVGVLAMPESPRWLVMQGRLGEARHVLNKISDSKEEAELRLADIKQAAGIPENCTDDVVQVTKQNHGEGVCKELLLHPTPSVRHILIAAVGIHFFQQASDTHKLLATIAVGLFKTMFILVATFLLDRVGRRPLLLTSVGGMIVCLASLGVSLTIIDHSHTKLMWAIVLSIASVLCFVVSFSIGMGPIAGVYSTEIFPLRLRAQGASMSVAANRVTSGVVSMTFISLYKGISIGGAFFLFTGIAMVSWVFFFTMLPETQGKTLEEIEGCFGNFTKKSNNKEVNVENNSSDQIQLGTNGRHA